MNIVRILMVGMAIVAGPAVFADTEHHPEQVSQTDADAVLSEGIVQKVDKSGGKVALRHGPLVNLGMPGMTMVFRVHDPKWLDQLRPGDKIRFRAERVNGVLTVVRYRLAE